MEIGPLRQLLGRCVIARLLTPDRVQDQCASSSPQIGGRSVGWSTGRRRDTDPADRAPGGANRGGGAPIWRHGRSPLRSAIRPTVRSPVEVTGEEMQDGLRAVAPQLRAALRAGRRRHIRRVARRQVPRGWRSHRDAAGVVIEQRVTPLNRVGCYVPAGRYPLPSSLLMTVIPARVAGVPEVIVVCPRPDTTVLAAAAIAGATRLFRLGGAHAVAAALAYGTATVPKVDKIVGPGSAYVAAAKSTGLCRLPDRLPRWADRNRRHRDTRTRAPGWRRT